MAVMEIKILFEDRYVILAEKPPKTPAQSDKTKDKDMVNIVENYLISKNPSNNKPYIGLVHRLDRPVGGVMIFAKNKFANRELSEQVRLKQMKKEYYAIVCGKPKKNEEMVEDYLKKLKTINMSKVVAENVKGSKKSTLKYKVIDTVETDEYGVLSLLNVELMTGRHHQIRVQLSNRGLPLWGDNKYNKIFVKKKEWTQIALCAYKLSFNHPKSEEKITVETKMSNQYPFNLFKHIL